MPEPATPALLLLGAAALLLCARALRAQNE
ncbi:PEP-CTERM sorting domain-containing protein [Scleromatobacter humisilvae]